MSPDPNQIERDRTWRIKEISDFKTVIKRSDRATQTTLLRGLLAVCYAHWEGSVRFSARKYMEHIALSKLRYDQLSRQFLRNYFVPRLSALASMNIVKRCELVDNILDSHEKRFTRVDASLIDTMSNLNSSVIFDICLICGVQPEIFEHDRSFVDVILLKRRNAIAHGENELIGVDDLDLISERTIDLMRRFGDAVENNIYIKAYKAA